MGNFVEVIKSKPLFHLGNFEVKIWHIGLLVVGWFLFNKFKK